ncbi:hypothetical protein [Enteractinococcus helveticum]|nr:hypothetical protein [Enteractinococcus helveticum]
MASNPPSYRGIVDDDVAISRYFRQDTIDCATEWRAEIPYIAYGIWA